MQLQYGVLLSILELYSLSRKGEESSQEEVKLVPGMLALKQKQIEAWIDLCELLEAFCSQYKDNI